MNATAISHLVCPETQQPLEVEAVEQIEADIITGRLCRDDVEYPIRNGLASFVAGNMLQTQTVRSFAQKWDKHQYYRSHTGDFYTQWYLDRYGFGEREKLRDALQGASFILDAGTGSGRDALNFAAMSDALVFGVDTAASALEVARKEAKHPRVAFLHADVTRLPFPDDFFDFINCDQVIHHTPDPRATFEHLRRKLKPGGQICCYVYKEKGPVREFTDDYVRKRIQDLPADEALKLCEGITHLGHQLADLNITLNIEQDIPLLGIKKGPVDLQRFIHWNVMKCFWNDDFDFFTNNIINFDWYHPEHCFRFTPDQFRTWFERGWDILAWDVQDAGISCRARKN